MVLAFILFVVIFILSMGALGCTDQVYGIKMQNWVMILLLLRLIVLVR